MLGIAMACDRDPSVLDRWFPGDLRDPKGALRRAGQRTAATGAGAQTP